MAIHRVRMYTVDAIILKRRNLGEADRILTILSKEFGKMRVMAKGIRRIISRRSAHLEVFSHSTLVLFRGSIWDGISQASALDVFPALRNNLFCVSSAYYLSELVDALLPEMEKHPDIHALLLDAFWRINCAKEADLSTINEQYALALLRALGYLSADLSIPGDRIDPYIEKIIEKRLRTPKILSRLGTMTGESLSATMHV